MAEAFRKEIVQRFSKNFLDIHILRLVQTEPMWGYRILKKTEELFQVKLRHGALYPLLNSLQAKGLLKSKKEVQKGRVRKVYEITKKGTLIVDAYNEFLRQQLKKL